MPKPQPQLRTLYLADSAPEQARIPIALFPGELELGGTLVDCYVLDDGRRVISLRSAVLSLTGKEHGRLGEIIGVSALKPFIDSDLALGENCAFEVPRSPFLGKGLTSSTYLRICKAFMSAFAQGALRTEAQQRIAMRCGAILGGCSEVGLVALIDEATGFQALRAERELEHKLREYVTDDLRRWEKTFPDELWVQFKRLTGWRGSIHRRPRWWGKLVNELVYDALDRDIALYLRTTRPPPRHGQNYHQWMTEDRGVRALLAHIHKVIGMAMFCHTMNELRERVAHHFGTREAQPSLFWPQNGAHVPRVRTFRDAA